MIPLLIGACLIPVALIGGLILWIASVIKEHGLLTLAGRFLIGRHYTGDHYTFATFWHDGNGRVRGIPTHSVRSRHHRAGYKNLIRSLSFLIGCIVMGIAAIYEPMLTLLVTIALLIVWIYAVSYRAFRKYQVWRDNRNVVYPLATALAILPDVSEQDMANSITMKQGWQKLTKGELGRITFPATFHMNKGEVDTITGLVERRFPMPVDVVPNSQGRRPMVTISAAPQLPREILFREHLDDIRACKPRTYIAGYDRVGNAVILSHAADKPMKAGAQNPGTGKTAYLRQIGAQILGGDPSAKFIGFDTKGIGLEMFKSIPGCTVFSDVAKMREMWEGWYDIAKEVRRRYAEIRIDPGLKGTYDDWWIFIDEGNDFCDEIKALWVHEMRGEGRVKGDPMPPMSPPIWYDCIAMTLRLGREVGIFVIAQFQDFKERNFGNMGLRNLFTTVNMAGFKPSQYKTIMGTSPAPACQVGQGRILVCELDREVWVQGLYDTEEYLITYASQGR